MKLKLLFMAIGLSSAFTQNIEATAWKQGAKRLFHAGCTVTGFGIAVGPGLYKAYDNRSAATLLDTELANGDVAALNNPTRPGVLRVLDQKGIKPIDAALKKLGVVDPVVLYPNEVASLGNGVFTVSEEFIVECSEQGRAFVLAHEVGHDTYNDAQNDTPLRIGSTLATVGAFKLLKRKLFSKKYIAHPTITRSILKIPAGAAMAAVSYAGYNLLGACMESRADSYAASRCTPQEIRKFIVFLQIADRSFRQSLYKQITKPIESISLEHHERCKHAIDRGDASIGMQAKHWARGFLLKLPAVLPAGIDFIYDNSIVHRVLGEHPTTRERVAYLEQEIVKKEALENSQGTNL